MSKLLLLILTFWLVDASPRVIFLRELINNRTVNEVEEGAHLYLASNDNNDYLKNITITSGNTSITLDQINLDEPLPYSVINDGLNFSTTNNESVMNNLTGYLYITSKKQANDPSFFVYVIKKSHRITTTPPKSTVVVLNTQLSQPKESLDTPDMNSYITGIDQSPDTNLTFYVGYPYADWLNATYNQFFRNPLYLENSEYNRTYSNTKRIFFDNVDDLQVPIPTWYFIVEGPITMNISNYYEANYNYTTKNVNTTGLIINQGYFNSREINFQLDLSRSRIVGTLISTNMLPNESVNFIFTDNNGGSWVQSYTFVDPIQTLAFTKMQASELFVNSFDLNVGSFFCQYFGFSGDFVPTSTTTTTTTTTTVISTTTSKPTPPVTSTTLTPIGTSSTSEDTNKSTSPSASPSTAPISTIETTTSSVGYPSILFSILVTIFSFFFIF